MCNRRMNKHIYTMEHNSAIKTNELLLTATASMNLTDIQRGKKKKSQSQNSTDCMIPFIYKNGMAR